MAYRGLYSGAQIDDGIRKVAGARPRGLFRTPAALGIRTGQLVYKKGNISELVSDLTRYYPYGYNFSIGEASEAGLTVACLATYGDDVNSGASFAQAKGTLAGAMALNPDIVFIDTGHYDMENGWVGGSTPILSKDLVMVGVNTSGGVPGVLFSSRYKTTWTDNGDGTYTSGTLGGTPIGVIDPRTRDGFGDYSKYSKKTNNDDVVATPNSWWISGGSGSTQVVTVNTGGLEPSNKYTWVQRSTPRSLNYQAGDYKCYMRNLTFLFGNNSGLSPYNGTDNSVFIAEDCNFRQAYADDGLRVQGVGLVITLNCKATGNQKDGFNYHCATNTDLADVHPHFIEVGNVGFNHSITQGTANGSTSHDECVGLRIGCTYGYGIGPGVADINNSKTYNVDVSSTNNYNDSNAKGFAYSDNAISWLDGCCAYNNTTADLAAAGDTTVYVHDCQIATTLDASSIPIQEFDIVW